MDYGFVDHHIEILNHHRDNSNSDLQKTFHQGSSQKNNKKGVSKENWKALLSYICNHVTRVWTHDRDYVVGRRRKNAICTLVRENYTSNMPEKTNLVLFIILPKIFSNIYNL